MSSSCPILVPLASFAVFWLPPESRKYFILLRRHRFESYSAHHSSLPGPPCRSALWSVRLAIFPSLDLLGGVPAYQDGEHLLLSAAIKYAYGKMA